MLRLAAACTLLCMFFVAPVEARQFKTVPCDPFDIMRPCGILWPPDPGGAASPRRARLNRGAAAAIGLAPQVLAHPAGCPRRAFCGCGASVEIFGRPIRSLFLAANWLRFPRVAPAPGMVAARRGHVFVLRQHINGSTWLAYDANSGGRRTRLHARSIAGFSIVNPHGAG
jgi:hypothetical protein